MRYFNTSLIYNNPSNDHTFVKLTFNVKDTNLLLKIPKHRLTHSQKLILDLAFGINLIRITKAYQACYGAEKFAALENGGKNQTNNSSYLDIPVATLNNNKANHGGQTNKSNSKTNSSSNLYTLHQNFINSHHKEQVCENLYKILKYQLKVFNNGKFEYRNSFLESVFYIACRILFYLDCERFLKILSTSLENSERHIFTKSGIIAVYDGLCLQGSVIGYDDEDMATDAESLSKNLPIEGSSKSPKKAKYLNFQDPLQGLLINESYRQIPEINFINLTPECGKEQAIYQFLNNIPKFKFVEDVTIYEVVLNLTSNISLFYNKILINDSFSNNLDGNGEISQFPEILLTICMKNISAVKDFGKILASSSGNSTGVSGAVGNGSQTAGSQSAGATANSEDGSSSNFTTNISLNSHQINQINKIKNRIKFFTNTLDLIFNQTQTIKDANLLIMRLSSKLIFSSDTLTILFNEALILKSLDILSKIAIKFPVTINDVSKILLNMLLDNNSKGSSTLSKLESHKHLEVHFNKIRTKIVDSLIELIKKFGDLQQCQVNETIVCKLVSKFHEHSNVIRNATKEENTHGDSSHGSNLANPAIHHQIESSSFHLIHHNTIYTLCKITPYLNDIENSKQIVTLLETHINELLMVKESSNFSVQINKFKSYMIRYMPCCLNHESKTENWVQICRILAEIYNKSCLESEQTVISGNSNANSNASNSNSSSAACNIHVLNSLITLSKEEKLPLDCINIFLVLYRKLYNQLIQNTGQKTDIKTLLPKSGPVGNLLKVLENCFYNIHPEMLNNIHQSNYCGLKFYKNSPSLNSNLSSKQNSIKALKKSLNEFWLNSIAIGWVLVM